MPVSVCCQLCGSALTLAVIDNENSEDCALYVVVTDVYPFSMQIHPYTLRNDY